MQTATVGDTLLPARNCISGIEAAELLNLASKNCWRVLDRLSDYLDGELDPETTAEVRRHLQECLSCGSSAEALRRIMERCHRYGTEVRPHPLTAASREQLRRAWQAAVARGGRDFPVGH